MNRLTPEQLIARLDECRGQCMKLLDWRVKKREAAPNLLAAYEFIEVDYINKVNASVMKLGLLVDPEVSTAPPAALGPQG